MKCACIALALSGFAVASWAGRPLATDDAGAAELGRCQLEGWVERDRASRSYTLAPACGIAEGLELGADITGSRPRDAVRAEAGLALKWAPPAWRIETAAGEAAFGLKAATGYQRLADGGWRHGGVSLLGLVSLKLGEAWSMHANLGLARDREARATATLFNLAVVWVPDDRVLLFGETERNNKRAVFGAAVHRAGARWWLQPERLGLDLTASRQSGAGGGTTWGLGFGWYGIALF